MRVRGGGGVVTAHPELATALLGLGRGGDSDFSTF